MGRHTFIALAMVGPLWWAMSSMTLAAEPVKVGVMDQQLVIERSKAGKRALEDLKAYQATRQKIISSDDQELKELEQTFRMPNSARRPSRKSRFSSRRNWKRISAV